MAKQSRHSMFTKSHLVAFGNYLLKTYGVQVHSSDGKNQPVYQREVTDADLSNWKDAEPIKSEYLRSDDDAVLQFTPNSTPLKCNILCVHTCRHIVKYDLNVWLDETFTLSTRIYNVDSKFVSPANHEERKPAHPEDYCKKCGGKNVVWSADNDLWNELMGTTGSIICPQCFDKLAKEKGVSIIFKAAK